MVKREPIKCMCLECKKEFFRYKRNGNTGICSPCNALKVCREWKRDNREKMSASKGAWRAANPEKEAAWIESNPEKVKEKARRHYWNNKERRIQNSIKMRMGRRTPKWANLGAIAKIYRENRRISIETGIPHNVDHIVPVNGKNVCGLHVENNLMVITALENRRKQNRWIT